MNSPPATGDRRPTATTAAADRMKPEAKRPRAHTTLPHITHTTQHPETFLVKQQQRLARAPPSVEQGENSNSCAQRRSFENDSFREEQPAKPRGQPP